MPQARDSIITRPNGSGQSIGTNRPIAPLRKSDFSRSLISPIYSTSGLALMSGEINSEVADQAAVIKELEAAYAGRDGVTTDRLDGLSVSHPDWTFNVRPSNTEPLLRLNVEGKDEATMVATRDDVLALIRKDR